MWTSQFWKDAIERAVKTAAQAALASIGAVSWANGGVTWGSTLVGLGIGVGVSFVMSILSSLVGDSTSASLVKTATVAAVAVLPILAVASVALAVVFGGFFDGH